MKTKKALPFLIMFCTIVFVVLLNTNLLAQPAAPLTPEQLSLHDQTVNGSILRTASATTQNAAHIAWFEPITESSGSPSNWGLFYRQLPNGDTINLSSFIETEGDAWSVYIQPGEGNDVCVVWQGQVSGGDYYLFLWNSALGNTTRSPDTVNSNGYFTIMPFNCNAQNDAKIVWYSDIISSQITYWDIASNQQQRISNSSSYTVRGVYKTEINEVLYIAWPESGRIYLWDSVSKVVQEIDSSGYASTLFMYSDKNDVIHMFWLLAGFMGPPCHRYWNSVDQTNELLMTCDDWEFSAGKDGAGNVHAAWAKSIAATSIEHFNATDNITNTISVQGQPVDKIKFIAGPDDKIHIFWQDDITNDLYYWNSQDQNKTYLIADAENNVLQNHLVWDFDSTGKIHISWSDGGGWDDIFYWNPSLVTPIAVLTGMNVIIDVDKQDIAHIAFISIHEIPGPQIYYWDSQTNVPMSISSTPIPDFDDFAVTNGIKYVLFRRSLDELYYWSSDEGEVPLGNGEELSYVVDESENIYLHWLGTRLTEQNDMYAAWGNQLNNFVYIPIVVSD
ncbi:MAG: hypothetical protein GY805_07520 [Chloroflexi bacterium]|nr:hypothetical protein [Chloroflexota bacterium]